MNLFEFSASGVGDVEVHTTTNRGHPPEFYAERICARLMFVADEAPPPIRDQALAFQERMKVIVLAGIRNAILSDHTTIMGVLRQAGMEDAAKLVHSLRS